MLQGEVGPPDPHPLDFDWRYSEATVDYLCHRLGEAGCVLLVGTPSVARVLERDQKKIVLVDRQPFQAVRNHWVVEPVGRFDDAPPFDTVLIDPPWYPADVKQWVSWAAQFARAGHTIHCSTWPVGTRPSAEEETKEILAWVRQWADVEINDDVLNYIRPKFEERVWTEPEILQGDLNTSPLRGSLLTIRIREKPALFVGTASSEHWVRFIINDYQLALRCRNNQLSLGGGGIQKMSPADSWVWPFVSRRAPLRDKIDLWSSENEAAIVQGVPSMYAALQNAVRASTVSDFEIALAPFPALLDWRIPRPPYWRSFEWHHK